MRMAGKRKRKPHSKCTHADSALTESHGSKRRKTVEDAPPPRTKSTALAPHPTLSPYYRLLLPLRAYLLACIPAHAKQRRKKIEAYGARSGDPLSQRIANVLDTFVIGCSSPPSPCVLTDEDPAEIHSLTQRTSGTAGHRSHGSSGSQEERYGEMGEVCLSSSRHPSRR
ncbi:hypothetical protein MRB53_037643 [Persea americana]|nr:hypothetical protein MRB53_037643 [Persea americana]